MTRILFVGQKPETVDFSDPSLPPGFDAEKINAGIAVGVRKIEERGWQRPHAARDPGPRTTNPTSVLRRTRRRCLMRSPNVRNPEKVAPTSHTR